MNDLFITIPKNVEKRICNVSFNPTRITIMTHNVSIAELTGMYSSDIELFNDTYNTKLNIYSTLYFNRLKAKIYRKKEGTMLMQKVIKECLKLKYDICLDINPYDNNIINLEQLIKFYASFGFVKVGVQSMVWYFKEQNGKVNFPKNT